MTLGGDLHLQPLPAIAASIDVDRLVLTLRDGRQVCLDQRPAVEQAAAAAQSGPVGGESQRRALKVVEIHTPKIEIRAGFSDLDGYNLPDGSLEIVLDDFVFVRVNYDYRYTSNEHPRWLAQEIVKLIAPAVPAPESAPTAADAKPQKPKPKLQYTPSADEQNAALTADPAFDRWQHSLPPETWARYDLHGARMGWNARGA